MRLADQIDLKPLINTYLFANTPMYLYRHFRRNASLKELAENNPAQRLVDEYKRRTSKKTKSTKDIVIAYSILVTITFLEYQQALAVFDMIDLSGLDWGNDIKDIYMSKIEITSVTRLVVKPQISHVEQTKSDGSTSTLLLNIH